MFESAKTQSCDLFASSTLYKIRQGETSNTTSKPQDAVVDQSNEIPRHSTSSDVNRYSTTIVKETEERIGLWFRGNYG